MQRILTSSEMFLCDRTEIETNTPSRILMYRAARACADAIQRILTASPVTDGTVAVLCGGGNNGGDGILCARLLCEDGIPAVIVPAFTDGDRLSAECAFRYDEARGAGVPVLSAQDFTAKTAGVTADVPAYRMIVDALFGIGLTREPMGQYALLIDAANRYAAAHRIPTVAIDIASGIFADTGAVGTHTFCASHTLAISHIKRGHLFYPGASYSGEVSVLDIGIPDDILRREDGDFPVYMLDDTDVRRLLPCRRPDSNKGSNGRILIAAGTKNMCGAAYLSARAAYRSGAGLVEIFTCEDNRIPLQMLLPEAILTTYRADDPASACDLLRASMARADAVVIGPGLGMSDTAAALVKTVLAEAAVPTVLDADALNLVAAHAGERWLALRADAPSARVLPPLMLTPHPGELSRLTGRPIGDCLADLIGTASRFAQAHGVTVNAKNTRSVITDGRRAFINPTGTSALAKGGSGDVLSGITATLAAQGCDALTAAVLAAYLHGRAAEVVSAQMGTRSPLASEICDALGAVLAELDHR